MDPYLLLAVAEGSGPAMASALLDPGADPQALLADPPAELQPAVRRRCLEADLERIAAAWLEGARRLGAQVLTPGSAQYPPRLRPQALRPLVLFARGDLGLLRDDVPSLTIVGSRTPTGYGIAAAMDFAAQASRAGLVLWSGLAAGVDALAHRAALDNATPTVAVLAGGLDRIYPQAHRPLAEEIVRKGGLCLSEAPAGARVCRGHFPRRNRILAAAVDAVLVVEAGLASGSLHTARFAADAGVPVFAVPGPYTSTRSRGCHDLIAEGAQIARDPEDLLRRLGVEAALRAPAQDSAPIERSADEAAVLAVLEAGPRPSDLVWRESRLERPRYLAALLSLTSKGLLRTLPGSLLARA